MLVFVIYAQFSKKAEIMLLLFTLNLVKTLQASSITTKQTSRWDAHLPYLSDT